MKSNKENKLTKPFKLTEKRVRELFREEIENWHSKNVYKPSKKPISI